MVLPRDYTKCCPSMWSSCSIRTDEVAAQDEAPVQPTETHLEILIEMFIKLQDGSNIATPGKHQHTNVQAKTQHHRHKRQQKQQQQQGCQGCMQQWSRDSFLSLGRQSTIHARKFQVQCYMQCVAFHQACPQPCKQATRPSPRYRQSNNTYE